jgi:hypothetical protein
VTGGQPAPYPLLANPARPAQRGSRAEHRANRAREPAESPARQEPEPGGSRGACPPTRPAQLPPEQIPGARAGPG